MKRYLIIVEKTEAGYSASSPDLPGWSSTAQTREALEKNMRQAIAAYLDSLHSHGQPRPAPRSYAVCVEFPD